MSYACFTLEIADHIAHIRFNRPERANAMTLEFWKEFPEAIERISNDAEARVIVISSEGKHFSAGMDISVFMSGALDADGSNPHVSAEAFRYKIKALQRTFSCLEGARQPVLAAIQGGAIGAGVDLATACDCRYASEDAFFTVQETAIGMTADVGTFPRLLRLIPEGWARQMAYTAERLAAAKAGDIGLVNEVFETPEALLDGVMAIARKIAAHSPLAVSGCKKMANYARDHSTADALDYVSVWNAAMLRPDDIKEAYIARGEKRAAVFDNLKPLKD
ncbi:crotonase/enoyl-CoA hydratase family protein [Hoeflea ulvae]|uniref:Crotonase/enoyl-CoA hydratase family protein n=1 Tax=Hoeflea ulvae TaxID=2983764 RepID=A0ABT3YC05_9HYPH|nr:crotonase/enoyl-CoA hydratase family protein [Hoeflea ulvae]MCY0093411.1 crotonase/enoyl-CoA hydratase family protein [Hoeflea ulvae]